MRTIIVALLIGGAMSLNWSWVSTVPMCVTAGWPTANDWWGKRDAASDNKGPLGCWLKKYSEEEVRRRAFEAWALESESKSQER